MESCWGLEEKKEGVVFLVMERGIKRAGGRGSPGGAGVGGVRGRGWQVRAVSSLCAFLPPGSGAQVNMS